MFYVEDDKINSVDFNGKTLIVLKKQKYFNSVLKVKRFNLWIWMHGTKKMKLKVQLFEFLKKLVHLFSRLEKKHKKC